MRGSLGTVRRAGTKGATFCEEDDVSMPLEASNTLTRAPRASVPPARAGISGSERGSAVQFLDRIQAVRDQAMDGLAYARALAYACAVRAAAPARSSLATALTRPAGSIRK